MNEAVAAAILESVGLLFSALESQTLESNEEKLLAFVDLAVKTLGPDIVKGRIDEWLAAKAPSDAAFIAKFGVQP